MTLANAAAHAALPVNLPQGAYAPRRRAGHLPRNRCVRRFGAGDLEIIEVSLRAEAGHLPNLETPAWKKALDLGISEIGPCRRRARLPLVMRLSGKSGLNLPGHGQEVGAR